MKIGSKVRRDGCGEAYIGTVIEFDGDKMVNVRFPGGLCCIDIDSLIEVEAK